MILYYCVVYSHIYTNRVPTGPGKSWKVMEFWRIIFQSWKVMENSKGHGKSWKMMIMSWNFYNCTEKFCSETANEVMLDRLL